jgi:hypothetical protein
VTPNSSADFLQIRAATTESVTLLHALRHAQKTKVSNVADCLVITTRLWCFRYSPCVVYHAHQFLGSVSRTMCCIIMDNDRKVLWPSLRCASVLGEQEGRKCHEEINNYYFSITFLSCSAVFMLHIIFFQRVYCYFLVCRWLALSVAKIIYLRWWMDHLWKYTDREKRKYLKENLSQCHAFHQKSQADWLRIEPKPPQWQTRAMAHSLLLLDLLCQNELRFCFKVVLPLQFTVL